ncbi:MAG: DUF4166 domain-containing protein [Burkholderiales bacterium]|nr:DUF4166 domain-containing protein [Burkholderiales bacterium]
MYERVMGASFTTLPVAVQRFHRLTGRAEWHGWVETQAPTSMPARLLALCLGTPRRASRGPLRFVLEAGPDTERWTRCFPHQTMRSRMRLVAGQIEESLGLARLRFVLAASSGTLTMELASLRFLGLPCPRWLLPRIVAEEVGTEEQLRFRVEASLPWVGLVASYRGHLDIGRAPRT